MEDWSSATVKIISLNGMTTRRGDALELKLTGKRRVIESVDEPGDFVVAVTGRVATWRSLNVRTGRTPDL